MNNNIITYVCVTTPNLEKMRRNLNVIMPFVDLATIVIGERNEEAEAYLKSWKEVTLVYREWDDSFKNQYQTALDNVNPWCWMLILDDDETPSEGMLQSLREAIKQSEGATNFDTVAFRCTDVHEGKVSSPSDYFREQLVAWNPDLHYEVNLHQALVGKKKAIRADANYYHNKSPAASLAGACRDYYIDGIWGDSEEGYHFYSDTPKCATPPTTHPAHPVTQGFRDEAWHQMKAILKRNHPEVELYRDLHRLIISSEICDEFRKWAEEHNESNDKRPHLHELYAFDKLIKGEY